MFTKEDIDSTPNLGINPHPTMPNLVVQQAGVEKLLRNLHPNKAASLDRLFPHFLKEVSNELFPLYTRLFQKSIDEGYVPRKWRATDISPIFKKGAKYDATNYRPLSLTSVTCKVLEHIIAKHLVTHLEENDLTDTQHGFRTKRSCETQIMNFTQELVSGFADGQQYDVNVMDFSKAFD